MTSMENMIGRAEIDDIDAILAIPTVDPDEVEHVVKNNADTIFSWDYSLARPALRKLYEKAKVGQWNATTDVPWDTDVDVEKTVAADQEILGRGVDPTIYDGTVVIKSAPGHTLGHQALYVRLPRTGDVLLSGDLYHFPQSRVLGRVPTFDVDQDLTRASREVVEAFLAETGAQLWIQHDAVGNALLRKSPQYYD